MKTSHVLAASFIGGTLLIFISMSAVARNLSPFAKANPAVLAQRQKDADEAARQRAKKDKHEADLKLMQEELCSGLKVTAMMDCLSDVKQRMVGREVPTVEQALCEVNPNECKK